MIDKKMTTIRRRRPDIPVSHIPVISFAETRCAGTPRLCASMVRGRVGVEKYFSADKFRQIPTRARFAAEFGPAKKTRSALCGAKGGKNRRKCGKIAENGRIFRDFSGNKRCGPRDDGYKAECQSRLADLVELDRSLRDASRRPPAKAGTPAAQAPALPRSTARSTSGSLT
jgi:hypothetical protein